MVKITIKLDHKEIDLTLDEAKELKQELDKLFTEPYVVQPWIQPQPYIPYTPWSPINPLITWETTSDVRVEEKDEQICTCYSLHQ